MKTKIVVKVSSMNDDKSRCKALKVSVCISGVESAELKGDEVLVVGEGIDAVELTRQLRKRMSYAELVSVSEVKKDNPPAAVAQSVAPEPLPPLYFSQYAPPQYGGYVHEIRSDPGCTIL